MGGVALDRRHSTCHLIDAPVSGHWQTGGDVNITFLQITDDQTNGMLSIFIIFLRKLIDKDYG